MPALLVHKGHLYRIRVLPYTHAMQSDSRLGRVAVLFRKMLMAFTSVTLIVLVAGCSARRPRAGVALTFDDAGVEYWFAARAVFREYKARATFFVHRIDTLTDEQLHMLRALQADGHEIACHGHRHVNVRLFMAESGRTADDFMQAEIFPALHEARARGFAPVTFAYAGGAVDDAVTARLLEHFRGVRTTNKYDPFARFDGQRVLGAVNIDHLFQEKSALALMEQARSNRWAVVFYGHKPAPHGGNYFVDYESLHTIMRHARQRRMKFYTFSDLLPDSASGGADDAH